MLELNQCYNMDCMKGMAQFPDGFFDLAVVDPPYFSGPERRGYYGSKVSKIGVHRDYPVSPVWEIPGRAYFDELRRVAKHYIVWGCNYFNYEFAPGRIVWDKCKKGTSFSDCELAATDLFNTVRLFRFMWNGFARIPRWPPCGETGRSSTTKKRPAVNRAEMRQDMNEDILTHGETMSEEQLLEGLRKTPELKRRLVMRVAADLLESEAFLEAYPHLETEEQIKTALTRLLHKNKVSTIDGRRMAAELAESYEGMYSHSDRSEGPASGHESHSSQPVT